MFITKIFKNNLSALVLKSSCQAIRTNTECVYVHFLLWCRTQKWLWCKFMWPSSPSCTLGCRGGNKSRDGGSPMIYSQEFVRFPSGRSRTRGRGKRGGSILLAPLRLLAFRRGPLYGACFTSFTSSIEHINQICGFTCGFIHYPFSHISIK